MGTDELAELDRALRAILSDLHAIDESNLERGSCERLASAFVTVESLVGDVHGRWVDSLVGT